ncbi:MAG: DNA-binding protein [Candidatus Bathyarchaeota archaeon]|nr:DNA-binding protein [Candidatus Bathyarchaeota archaeon]
MVKVILDSNFLFIPFQFQIDIFEELESLFGKAESVVLSTTLEELEDLKKKRSIKIRKQATAALEMTKRCVTVRVEKNQGESYDDVILRTAKEWRCPVATNDAELRKRLRKAGVATVFMRQKSYLEIEGYHAH